MRRSRILVSRTWTVALAAVALVCFVAVAHAQDDGVSVNANATGQFMPVGRVMLQANITILDGSALQSVMWTQTAGVPAVIAKATSPTAVAKLSPLWRYRNHLYHVLAEPPIGPEELPPNVEPPEEEEEEEFMGGLQNRWMVAGINPFSLEEAGLVSFEVKVVTTSGTYTDEVEVHTTLPWTVTTGLQNVPIHQVVPLHGKAQASYDWTLTTPAGSNAWMINANNRNPRFTPDVPGLYTVAVTDLAAKKTITLPIYAGTWRGVIVGQDADGRPVADGDCTVCHRAGGFAPDLFTPWAQTGHAEIFTNNLNTSSHYGTSCFSCHMVGYELTAKNNGADEAPDYMSFLSAGLLSNPSPDNWTMVLDDFPATAQMANIQCENCHGPQEAGPRIGNDGHGASPNVQGEPRVTLSSDVCGSCHGEPLRHARFQQWQISPHANYELAIDEGDSGTCSKCHTANGFLAWLPVLKGDVPGDPEDELNVTWTTDEIHPQTCQTCHDPHDVGTTTGRFGSNAKVRIQGDTPELLAGFKAVGVGKGALCMTCHNSRRGLRNDATFADDIARAPHSGPQTDVLMGESAYMVNVGVRGPHAFIENTCVTCHMEKTPPPELLAYNLGGTNHTFHASEEICSECHDEVTAEVLEDLVEDVLEDLKGLIEDKILETIAEQTAAGNAIDMDGEALITDASTIDHIEFGEARGRQGFGVVFKSGASVPVTRGTDIMVIRPAPLTPVEFFEAADPSLPKAGWNYFLVHSDGSHGFHNPRFVLTVLDASRDAMGGLGGPRAAFNAYRQYLK